MKYGLGRSPKSGGGKVRTCGIVAWLRGRVVLLLGWLTFGPASANAADAVSAADREFLAAVVAAVSRKDAAWIVSHSNQPMADTTHGDRRVLSAREYRRLVTATLTDPFGARFAAAAREEPFKNYRGVMIGDGLLWFTEIAARQGEPARHCILAFDAARQASTQIKGGEEPSLTGANFTGAASTPADDLEENPIRVEGIVSRHVFPGPPNFASIGEGDEREETWILTYSGPTGMAQFQLVILERQDELFAALRRTGKKRVEIAGTVWKAHTGHHHAPFLITVEAFRTLPAAVPRKTLNPK